MGAYQINVGFGVTGAEQLERGNTALDRTADRTKRVDEAIKGYVATNEKLNGKLVEVERQELRLESLREKHRMQTERLAASTDKQTVSQERLNAAHRHAVTDVQAASGALRAFEGTLPIRAVEQFVTKVLGLGGVLQMAFPIVGAVALLEVLDRGAEKLGIHIDLWRQIHLAEKDATAEIKKSAGEYDTLIEKLKEVQRQERRRALMAKDPKTGAILADQADAMDSLSQAERDRTQLRTLESEAAALRKIAALTLPTLRFGEQIRPKSTLTASDAFYAGLAGLEGIEAGGFPDLDQQQAARKRLSTLESSKGPLATARLQIETDIAAAKQKQSSADERIARNREESARKVAAIEEHILAIRKKAEEAAMKSYFGNSLEGKAAYEQVRLGVEEADEIRKNPAYANRIRGYYTLLRTSAYGEYADAIAKRDSAESYNLADISQSSTTHLYRQLQGMDVPDNPYAPPPPAGYRSAQRELRSVRDSERRYMSVARVSAQLSGQSEADQVQGQYGARLRFAEQEYQAELRLAELKQSESDKAVARADALDQKNQAIFDAQMEREKAILEMILRQQEAFERGVVGAVHAAARGGLGGFIRGQLENRGDEILGKLAGKLYQVMIEARKAKQGVPWADMGIGAGGADAPLIAATIDNSGATIDNSAAIRDLTSVLLSRDGGTVGGVGVGGGGTIGFPNGSGGPGVMGGSSSTIMYGFPGWGTPSPLSWGGKPLSRNQRIGAGVAAAGLGYEGVSTITHGGARNVVGGGGELAGAASFALMAAGVTGPAAPILAGVGLALGVISSLLGDPKAARQHEIDNRLAFGRYIDPVAIHASMTTYGGYADYDRFGGVRGSEFSPWPFIQPGYRDPLNGNAPVPGRTVGQFGNGPTIIYAMDGQDVKRVLTRHSDALGDSIVHTLDRGHTALQERLRG